MSEIMLLLVCLVVGLPFAGLVVAAIAWLVIGSDVECYMEDYMEDYYEV